MMALDFDGYIPAAGRNGLDERATALGPSMVYAAGGLYVVKKTAATDTYVADRGLPVRRSHGHCESDRVDTVDARTNYGAFIIPTETLDGKH